MFIFSTCLQKSSSFRTVSTPHGHKCTSDVCLRTCRGHEALLSDMDVCRGTGAPGPRALRGAPPLTPSPLMPESPQLSHTYLPVKSFIPLHNWSMTVSTCGIRCFLHPCYTDYIWINVLVAFFGATFFSMSWLLSS